MQISQRYSRVIVVEPVLSEPPVGSELHTYGSGTLSRTAAPVFSIGSIASETNVEGGTTIG